MLFSTMKNLLPAAFPRTLCTLMGFSSVLKSNLPLWKFYGTVWLFFFFQENILVLPLEWFWKNGFLVFFSFRRKKTSFIFCEIWIMILVRALISGMESSLVFQVISRVEKVFLEVFLEVFLNFFSRQNSARLYVSCESHPWRGSFFSKKLRRSNPLLRTFRQPGENRTVARCATVPLSSWRYHFTDYFIMWF